MCFIALLAAVLCVIAPFSLPIGPVPISLATFAVYLAGALLGCGHGTAAVALYLVIGSIGVPVFAGWSAGFSNLIGPTGGYLLGYLPCAAIVGFGVGRWGGREARLFKNRFYPAYPLSMAIGTLVLYALGTAWFMMQLHYTFASALAVCVLPFLPGDAVKIAAASVLAPILRKRLSSK